MIVHGGNLKKRTLMSYTSAPILFGIANSSFQGFDKTKYLGPDRTGSSTAEIITKDLLKSSGSGDVAAKDEKLYHTAEIKKLADETVWLSNCASTRIFSEKLTASKNHTNDGVVSCLGCEDRSVQAGINGYLSLCYREGTKF